MDARHKLHSPNSGRYQCSSRKPTNLTGFFSTLCLIPESNIVLIDLPRAWTVFNRARENNKNNYMRHEHVLRTRKYDYKYSLVLAMSFQNHSIFRSSCFEHFVVRFFFFFFDSNIGTVQTWPLPSTIRIH